MSLQETELWQQQPPLKLAFIGGGVNSAIGQTHFAASQLDGRWQVVGGAFSRCDTQCRQTIQAWNLQPRFLYTDWRTMLDDPDFEVDAVAVLTPTPDHYEVLLALLARQIPIICEKALVQNLAEAETLAAQFDPARHFLAVTYNYSGYPMVRELRHWISQGRLGQLLHIELEMPQEGFLRPLKVDDRIIPPQSWRRQDGQIPTICLDLGVHLHHLARFVGDLVPEAVMAEMASFSQWGVIDHVQALVRFTGGTRGGMWFSKVALGHRNGLRLRVYGSEGSAHWYQMAPENLTVHWADGRIEQVDRSGKVSVAGQRRYMRMKPGHPAGFVEAFANLYWDLADALWQWRQDGHMDHPYVYGLDHAWEGLRLWTAARRSFASGQWETV
ncbi:MAG TPA: Gfo/Idh/MocA family oxidoreductase [Piscirickettsiaceae bacterium]|nr:Gfo/Idh/MocA family oxidoreductase [Piscirickettsiaceae bacterium]HIQ39648.1 Gfo/Idh/MocA family oxidoreductase [Sulfurivirga caldicuralii]